MCAFRETFSRPVKPIRFLGLFDTVNSVPRFENAWMQRSKFPYTARSSARVIRHAVSIDERRAKFRQDLISQEKPNRKHHYKGRQKHWHPLGALGEKTIDDGQQQRGRKMYMPSGRLETLAVPGTHRDRSEAPGVRNLSPSYSVSDRTRPPSAASSVSNYSLDAIHMHYATDSDDEGEQDIQEVWFAGCHTVSLSYHVLYTLLTRLGHRRWMAAPSRRRCCPVTCPFSLDGSRSTESRSPV